MIHLVRHADAGARSDHQGVDAARPLSARGREQAAAIADLLAGDRITRIMSSPALRCRQTVEPLAERLGLPVQIERALSEGAGLEAATALILESGSGSVLSAHGDVVADVIGSTSAAGVPVEGGLRWEKGGVWELALDGGRIISARYLRTS